MASVSYGATGIDFSDYQTPEAVGTAAMASELLDHYEEGTWTGTVTGPSNAMTMVNNGGQYTRIGNMVTLTGYFNTSSTASANGAIKITGIPWTVGSGNAAYASAGAGYGSNYNITASESAGYYGAVGNAHLQFTIWNVSTGVSDMQESHWSDDGTIMIFFAYRVA